LTKILVIEDDPDHALYTKIILEKADKEYQVVYKTDPKEGLKEALTGSYNLILSDYRMPGMTALDILQELVKKGISTPFVVATASGNEKIAVELMKAGAYDYVLKDLSYEETLPVVVERVLNVFQSLLKRQELEREVKQAVKEWETTFNSISDMISLQSVDFTILRVNKSYSELFERDGVNVIGRKCYEIIHNASQPVGKCPCVAVLKTKKESVNDFWEPRLGKYIEISVSPILDDEGEITGFVHVIRDITQRKNAEREIKEAYLKLKEAQQELIQSEKMAALGRFSSGIAHEVKNPLGVILGGIEYLENETENSSVDTHSALEKIKEATLRADGIIRSLLKFSRPAEMKTDRLNPVDLVKEAISLIRYHVESENIDIKAELSEDNLFIKVDKNQIVQVLFNIFINAIESMPDGGTVRAKVYKSYFPESSKKDSFCVMEIADEGEGVSNDNLDKIFEPFFTTKRDKKGIGLGLYIVKAIMDNHKGRILIESKLGQGTIVKLIFPLV